MPPEVATFLEVDVLTGTLDDYSVLYRRRIFERLVGVLLEWNRLAATRTLVCVMTIFASASLIRSPQTLGGEPAKDYGVGGADAGAGEHRYG